MASPRGPKSHLLFAMAKILKMAIFGRFLGVFRPRKGPPIITPVRGIHSPNRRILECFSGSETSAKEVSPKKMVHGDISSCGLHQSLDLASFSSAAGG